MSLLKTLSKNLFKRIKRTGSEPIVNYFKMETTNERLCARRIANQSPAVWNVAELKENFVEARVNKIQADSFNFLLGIKKSDGFKGFIKTSEHDFSRIPEERFIVRPFLNFP